MARRHGQFWFMAEGRAGRGMEVNLVEAKASEVKGGVPVPANALTDFVAVIHLHDCEAAASATPFHGCSLQQIQC